MALFTTPIIFIAPHAHAIADAVALAVDEGEIEIEALGDGVQIGCCLPCAWGVVAACPMPCSSNRLDWTSIGRSMGKYWTK